MEILFIFGKELRQPFSEVLSLPWYDIELIWHIYEEWVEQQNNQQKIENKKYEQDMSDMQSKMPNENSINRMMQQQQNNMKMPDMPDFNNLNNFNF